MQNSGNALADILTLNPFVLLLTVHFKLNLSIKSLAKRFNSSSVKEQLLTLRIKRKLYSIVERVTVCTQNNSSVCDPVYYSPASVTGGGLSKHPSSQILAYSSLCTIANNCTHAADAKLLFFYGPTVLKKNRGQ